MWVGWCNTTGLRSHWCTRVLVWSHAAWFWLVDCRNNEINTRTGSLRDHILIRDFLSFPRPHFLSGMFLPSFSPVLCTPHSFLLLFLSLYPIWYIFDNYHYPLYFLPDWSPLHLCFMWVTTPLPYNTWYTFPLVNRYVPDLDSLVLIMELTFCFNQHLTHNYLDFFTFYLIHLTSWHFHLLIIDSFFYQIYFKIYHGWVPYISPLHSFMLPFYGCHAHSWPTPSV